MSLSSRGGLSRYGAAGEDKVCGAHSRSVKCIALISSRGPRKSAAGTDHVRCAKTSAYFPGADFRRGRKTQAKVFAHRTWSVPAADLRGPLELSSAMHFTERECAPQTLSSPAAPNRDKLPPGRKTHIHPIRWPPRPLAAPSAGRTGGALACLTKSRLNSSLYIAFLSIVII